MNAPNMAFFGHEDTREVLQQIKESTNNEEFDLSFKNKERKFKNCEKYNWKMGGLSQNSWSEDISLKFAINGKRNENK